MQTDDMGFEDLGRDGILQLSSNSIARRWWQDVGRPDPISTRINKRVFKGSIYRLTTRKNDVIAI